MKLIKQIRLFIQEPWQEEGSEGCGEKVGHQTKSRHQFVPQIQVFSTRPQLFLKVASAELGRIIFLSCNGKFGLMNKLMGKLTIVRLYHEP